MSNPAGIFRRASPAEAPAFTAVTHAAFAKWIPLIGRQPQPMTVNYADELAAHQGWLLIGDDDQPIGALLLMTRPDHLLIYSIAILPDHQGRGHGRRLLDLAEREALRQGFHEIRLYTNARFVANIDLYRRVGYHVTHSETLPAGTLVHMAKALPSPPRSPDARS